MRNPAKEWTAELYVHAIAVEAEAARRYAELARRMERNAQARALFSELAAKDQEHLQRLRCSTQAIPLPTLTSDHSWSDQGDPLTTALGAERDARAFFEHAGRIAQEPAARALAEEMAREESEHIARIERLMADSQCTGES
jgi:rubrerythrin